MPRNHPERHRPQPPFPARPSARTAPGRSAPADERRGHGWRPTCICRRGPAHGPCCLSAPRITRKPRLRCCRSDRRRTSLSRGYAVVIQDTRGRFKSEGEFYPFRDDGWGERRDGYDTVEAIAKQKWCNGRVGTLGGSYAGHTQYAMAPTAPPHLSGQFVRHSIDDFPRWLDFPGRRVRADIQSGLGPSSSRRPQVEREIADRQGTVVDAKKKSKTRWNGGRSGMSTCRSGTSRCCAASRPGTTTGLHHPDVRRILASVERGDRVRASGRAHLPLRKLVRHVSQRHHKQLQRHFLTGPFGTGPKQPAHGPRPVVPRPHDGCKGRSSATSNSGRTQESTSTRCGCPGSTTG